VEAAEAPVLLEYFPGEQGIFSPFMQYDPFGQIKVESAVVPSNEPPSVKKPTSTNVRTPSAHQYCLEPHGKALTYKLFVGSRML
tara:strand:- start:114 stop:365 length:252 start_codon:yes stop_codon:yes gene_type:complete